MNADDPAMLSDYARGLARGGIIALEDLLEGVQTQQRETVDPSASGPTWDGLERLLRDALARTQERFPS